MLEQLRKDNFKKVISSDKPTLVTFSASWCGPCKVFDRSLQLFAEDHKEKINFYKVDVDKEYAIAAEYDMLSIPTSIVFKKGVILKRIIGVKTNKELETELKNLLEVS